MSESEKIVADGVTDAEMSVIADGNDAEACDTPPDEDLSEIKDEASEGEVAIPDYTALIEEDIREIKRSFPTLGEDFDIRDLKNPVRYGALRDLGLTATEAYLATGGKRARGYDNRAHLTASVPRGARSPLASIPRDEMKIARELFSGMSESDIERLYRKVAK